MRYSIQSSVSLTAFYIISAFLLAFGLLSNTGWSQTPDEQTPSAESVCDGLGGAAYGLCNAYCEAMDCDSEYPSASEKACDRVADNFDRITGGETFPCEEEVSVCEDVIALCPDAIEIGCLTMSGECIMVCDHEIDVSGNCASIRCFPCE